MNPPGVITPNLNSPPPESFLSSQYLNPDYLFSKMVAFLKFVFRKETLTDLNTILLLLAFFFITLIFYCIVRLFEIRRKEHAHLHHEMLEYAHHQKEREKKMREGEAVSHNERWRKVLDYVFSESDSDWKLAVIEADSMLDTLLDQLGFKGENMGEKLKTASEDNFRSLTNAWEVHTVRNRIAHEGTEFNFSHHEAKRVIALYEQIFRLYGYI